MLRLLVEPKIPKAGRKLAPLPARLLEACDLDCRLFMVDEKRLRVSRMCVQNKMYEG